MNRPNTLIAATTTALAALLVAPLTQAAPVAGIQAEGEHEGWITGYTAEDDTVHEAGDNFDSDVGSIQSELSVDHPTRAERRSTLLDASGHSQVQTAETSAEGFWAFDWASDLSVQSTFTVSRPTTLRLQFDAEVGDGAEGAGALALKQHSGEMVFDEFLLLGPTGTMSVNELLQLDRGRYVLSGGVEYGGVLADGASSGGFELAATVAPLPSTAWSALGLLSILGGVQGCRRRQRTLQDATRGKP